METHLPTPMTARVYANLPEGWHYIQESYDLRGYQLRTSVPGIASQVTDVVGDLSGVVRQIVGEDPDALLAPRHKRPMNQGKSMKIIEGEDKPMDTMGCILN